MATQLILNAVAEACGVERAVRRISSGIERREQQRADRMDGTAAWHAKIGRDHAGRYTSNGTSDLVSRRFNPIHRAHKRMAEVAAERCGSPVTFELSITNVDKPPLDFIEIADRLSQFQGEQVLLTRAPTFVEKAEIAPAACLSSASTRWCASAIRFTTAATRPNATRRSKRLPNRAAGFSCSADRSTADFDTLSDVELPPALRALCDEVPESEFREDVSSTELRRG